MADDRIAALVGRIVAGARIPGASARDDLRRELLAHFEDAATTGSLDRAIHAFGREEDVAALLHRVHRGEYVALYLAKIAASIVLSFAAALLIVAVVNLRVELRAEVVRLAPGFSRVAGLALAVVLGVVAGWEIVRRPFNGARACAAAAAYAALGGAAPLVVANGAGAFLTAAVFAAIGLLCARVTRGAVRWALLVAAFAGMEYGLHFSLNVPFPPARALAAGVILAGVWTSTAVILARADRLFGNFFQTR